MHGMQLIDANVLIYAVRDDAVDHPRYFQWLAELYSSGDAFALTDLTAAAFLRITTNPKAMVNPFTMDEAIAALDDVRSRATCRWLYPMDQHWTLFQRLCRAANVNANLVNDAWLAALAIESGCELISTDRDFARFPGLRWKRPLDA